MSDQMLNLKRSLQILRQHWITVGFIVLLGFFAGAGVPAVSPHLYSDTALVVLSNSTRNMPTQALIADSNPVLSAAAQSLHPAMSVQALSKRVQVATPIAFVLSISAQGKTAVQAVDTANAVADSYVAYVSGPASPGGKVSARVLQHARSASKTPLLAPMLTIGGIGALAAGLLGTVGVLAVYRSNRRLRRRDEMADAIGVPVLASVVSRHPRKAHHWARLLDDYVPSAADGRRLRNALNHLGVADPLSARAGSGGSSVTVLSLSPDWRALALGPQLAVFAASQGILTALIIGGGRPDLDIMAELRAACVARPSSRRSKDLLVALADHGSQDWPDAALTVVVAVVDGWSPDQADTLGTDAMVLAVSAGAVTAEELARVAASKADGRYIAGILMADPDPADPTTGRMPQLGPGTEVQSRVPGRVS